MRRLTKDQCTQWLFQNRFVEDGHHVFPSGRNVAALDFTQPKDSRALAVIGREVASACRGHGKMLLLITEWGVWPTEEWWPLFNRAMIGFGDGRPIGEAPGLLFADDESNDLGALVRFALNCGWSAAVLPSDGSVGFCLTDDDWLGMFASSRQAVDDWIKLFVAHWQVSVIWEGQVRG